MCECVLSARLCVCVSQVALRDAEQRLEAMALAEQLLDPDAAQNDQIQVNDITV